MWIHLLMLSCLSLATFADNSEEKSPATVRIHHERSTDSELVASVDAFGETHHLNLKQIELPSVRAHEILETLNGTIITKEVPEDNSVRYYEDDVTGALLYMADDVLEGMVTDSISIRYENKEHVATKIDGKSSEPFCATKDNDAELAKLTVLTEESELHDDGKALTFFPEILSLFDSEMYRKFGNNGYRLIRYAKMFFKIVDRRFRTVSNANVYLRLSAIYYSTSSSVDNRFMDVNGQNIYTTLKKFATFMGTSGRSMKAHDISYLASGRKFQYYAGLAYVGTPCLYQNNYAYNTGVGTDDGFYGGMLTAAHELGHSLGSPHDPKDSSSCGWNRGYLMSYVRTSYKRFFFSSCSSNSMRSTYYKNHATCLRKISSTSHSYPSGYPGTYVTLDTQCKLATRRSNAVARTNVPESNHCFKLHCQYRSGSTTWYYTSGTPALEGSRCRSGKRCFHGYCR